MGRLKLIQTNKRVVSNKDRVVGKIVLEKLGVWTRLLETLEYKGSVTLADSINFSIKSAARSITRTRFTDKIWSDTIMQKAGLWYLNEMVAYTSTITVWKSNKCLDPLGSLIFLVKTKDPSRTITTWSKKVNKSKFHFLDMATLQQTYWPELGMNP